MDAAPPPPLLEPLLAALALAPALWLRPWRLLGHAGLQTPLLATLALLPLLWALPLWRSLPLQLHWSGACLVALCLGWPLAVLTLTAVALLTWLITPLTFAPALALLVWQGLVPATLALGIGALLRRFAPHHLFVYVLGRAFLGTVLSLFASSLLAYWSGHAPLADAAEPVWVAQWLMAWGDAVVTGMLAAIFVAFQPQWLATWSDSLYLRN